MVFDSPGQGSQSRWTDLRDWARKRGCSKEDGPPQRYEVFLTKKTLKNPKDNSTKMVCPKNSLDFQGLSKRASKTRRRPLGWVGRLFWGIERSSQPLHCSWVRGSDSDTGRSPNHRPPQKFFGKDEQKNLHLCFEL